MAWREQSPHTHSASATNSPPERPRQNLIRRLGFLILLLSFTLPVILFLGKWNAPESAQDLNPQVTPLRSIVTVEELTSTFDAGVVSIHFDVVLTSAVTSVESVDYLLERESIDIAEPPLAGTVNFAQGEYRKRVYLTYNAENSAASSLALTGSSSGVAIGREGRYQVIPVDVTPAPMATLHQVTPLPATTLKAQPRPLPKARVSNMKATDMILNGEGADKEEMASTVLPTQRIAKDINPTSLHLKLDANGQPLSQQSADFTKAPWSCVSDRSTGLVWEVKSDDGGLHDKKWTYTWYNANPATNGGDAGTAGKGLCGGTLAAGCDTDKYVAEVNATGLCGARDWRLPTQEELQSLVDLARSNPSIDSTLFPHAQPSWYWSSSPVASDAHHAWVIGYNRGYDVWGRKSSDFYVRLVRSGH